MKSKLRYLLSLMLILFGFLIVFIIVYELDKEQASEDSKAAVNYKTVIPIEDTTTILKNPFMGFQDSNVNNDWYPWSTGYLRANAACVQDGRTVSCNALNWDTLNPQQGVYDFSSIDLYIQNIREREKYMVFRIRNVREDTDLPYVPAWATNLGVTTSWGQESFEGRTGVEVDYHKCVFLDLWDDLVAEMITKYDNEPVISAIDIGSYGWYGEWFSGKSVLERAVGWGEDPNDANDPTLQQSIDTRTRIIKMFTGGSGQGRCLDNNGQEQIVSYNYQGFRNKPVIMSKGDKEDLKIGIDNGAGARFDIVGDLGGQQGFRKATDFVALPWQTKPIIGEFDSATPNASFVQRALCYSREFHVSSLHNNWGTKPSVDMNGLFRELGYRILPTEISYTDQLNTNENLSINFKWVNKGTSPAYERYPLYLYVKPAGDTQVIKRYAMSNTDITKILPANVTSTSEDFLTCPVGTPPVYEVNETIAVSDLPAGTYDAFFGFEEPVYLNSIELAVTQKDANGFYTLGQFSIQDGEVIPPVLTYCGDGTRQTPNSAGVNEQCDDGNTTNFDGCNAICQVERTGNTNTPPTGSGIIYVPQEQNDNTTDSDDTQDSQDTTIDQGVVIDNNDDGDTPTSDDSESNTSTDNLMQKVSDGVEEAFDLERSDDNENMKHIWYLCAAGVLLFIISSVILVYLLNSRSKKQNTF